MRILITNDDGVHSPALVYLRDALVRYGQVEIVAPEKEASASSHAITTHHPLRFYPCTLFDGSVGWAVSGTPADCVILGMLKLGKPDIVISGINPGANLGDDVTYSGTVGAAFEAALYGINALAISVLDYDNPDYGDAARIVTRILDRYEDILKPFFLNVNIPSNHRDELRITKLGRRLWSNNVQERMDPRNKPYFWISGAPKEIVDADSDIYATKNGYISVTPISLDLTDYTKVKELQQFFNYRKNNKL